MFLKIRYVGIDKKIHLLNMIKKINIGSINFFCGYKKCNRFFIFIIIINLIKKLIINYIYKNYFKFFKYLKIRGTHINKWEKFCH